MTAASSTRVLEMGYTTDEFARVLPAAMRDWSVEGGPRAWQVAGPDAARVASVLIEPRADRVMGSLRLPVLSVTLTAQTDDPGCFSEFLRRFERGFHRGGG